MNDALRLLSPIGMAANPKKTGQALSGVGNWLGSNLFGSDAKVLQSPLFNQQQLGAMSQLLQQGLSNQNFGNIEDQAKESFFSDYVPSLAERFTSMGGQGGQRGSGFAQALNQGWGGLQSQLAGLRAQYGLSQTQMGLGRPFENTLFPKDPGLLRSGMNNISQLIPLLQMLGGL